MRWNGLPIIAFDTETTGLNPEEGHRVIEFAGVELRLGADGRVEEAIPHHYLFNPGIPIPREATEVSGLRDEDVADKPPFEAHAARIHALLANAVTVAHNYPFDQRFLTHEFERAGLRWCAPPVELDTVDLSRKFFPDAKSHKLGELAQRLEVTLIGAHRATNDAEACGRCFVALANRHDAPRDIPGLVEWADAVGEPPATGGFLGRAADRTVVFTGGELDGKPVNQHPDHLAWMTFARSRVDGTWQLTFPPEVRAWAERWLRIRASGRAAGAMKGFGPNDWGIDPPVGAS